MNLYDKRSSHKLFQMFGRLDFLKNTNTVNEGLDRKT